MEVVFATKNKGKLAEIIEILAPVKVISMDELGIIEDILEDGQTFSENAVKKACTVATMCGKTVLADDSGIEIDFLDGAPGVHSARFMGTDTSYDIKNAKILEMMKGVPCEKRTARFVCVIAAALTNGRIIVETGTIEGRIADEVMGTGGFGYDPIFYVPEFGITTAQMNAGQKNAISHRGKALRKIKEALLNEAPCN